MKRNHDSTFLMFLNLTTELVGVQTLAVMMFRAAKILAIDLGRPIWLISLLAIRSDHLLMHSAPQSVHRFWRVLDKSVKFSR